MTAVICSLTKGGEPQPVRLLTIPEAARLYRLKTDTVRDFVLAGKIGKVSRRCPGGTMDLLNPDDCEAVFGAPSAQGAT